MLFPSAPFAFAGDEFVDLDDEPPDHFDDDNQFIPHGLIGLEFEDPDGGGDDTAKRTHDLRGNHFEDADQDDERYGDAP